MLVINLNGGLPRRQMGVYMKYRRSCFILAFCLLLVSGLSGCSDRYSNSVSLSEQATESGVQTEKAGETNDSGSMKDDETQTNEFYGSEEGMVLTFAGNLTPGIRTGSNTDSEFFKPYGLCSDSEGNLIIIDSYANLIHLSKDGSIIPLAGNSERIDPVSGYPFGGYLNGNADEALLNHPRFAAASTDGDILVTDTDNHCIRILRDHSLLLFAGSQTPGYLDGTFEEAMFNTPSGIDIASDGTVYVADTLNHCIRAISSDGIVTTIAGIPGVPGYEDGTLAQARFCEPNDIELSPDGSLYVVDKGNQRVRLITPEGVSTVAGSGIETDSTTGYIIGGYLDGTAEEAQFQYPTGLSLGPDGTIYLADTGNHCIRMISQSGTVSTIAGSKMPGNANGTLKLSRFNQPLDVLYTSEGLYISDSYNHVVRLLKQSKDLESSPAAKK